VFGAAPDTFDAALARVVEDANDTYATLQVNNDGPSGEFWANIAQLDGVHVGDTVAVVLGPDGDPMQRKTRCVWPRSRTDAWTSHKAKVDRRRNPSRRLNNIKGNRRLAAQAEKPAIARRSYSLFSAEKYVIARRTPRWRRLAGQSSSSVLQLDVGRPAYIGAVPHSEPDL
jgi:hypothetical protein